MPAPANFEDFRDNFLPKMLEVFGPEVAAFLQKGTDADRDFSDRILYAILVHMINHPDMPRDEAMYRMFYELAESFLAMGKEPVVALEELKQVPWDTLPEMDGYARETLNSIASRAFADAVDGRPFAGRIS